MKPLLIGQAVRVDPPLILAPLAGHTDRAFRGLVKRLGGCGLVVTEMVSSEALTRGSEISRQIASVSREERPVGVQIFGCDPARMAEAASMVQCLGADLVDVNMGCPVPKVTRKGAGAALMRDLKLASALVSRMANAARIPITVKIRSGWDRDSINAAEAARALEDAGAAAITIHPRCRSERHRGRAAWRVIAEVKRSVSVPVIGNGDVASADDARAMFEQTAADGIMIGRGALMNPWVFRQISEELAGASLGPAPPLGNPLEALEFFVLELHKYLPDEIALHRVKALAGWMTRGWSHGAELRRSIYGARCLPELRPVLESYFSRERSDSGAENGREEAGDQKSR